MYVGYILVLLTLVKQLFTTPLADICKNGVCGEVSSGEILRIYRGLFFTNEEREQKEHTIQSVRRIDLEHEGADAYRVMNLPGDGDSCCATEFHYIRNTTMVNSQQEEKYIVQLPDADPPVYQLIRVGSCINYYGFCDGECLLEPLFLNLLIWDPSSTANPPVTFDWFQVPGYCSCKNIYPISVKQDLN